jgi:transposase-like protein
MSQRPYQRYTTEFKEKALSLLALIGKAIAEVAQIRTSKSAQLYQKLSGEG